MKKVIKSLILVALILIIPGVLFKECVKASSSNVNVTVPANINAVFNSDGTNTISTFSIMNDSLVPIKVVDVTSTQTNGWELISNTNVLTKDTKKLKLMLDGKVITNGTTALNIDIADGTNYTLPIKIDRGAWTTTVKESAFNLAFNYEIGKKQFNLSFDSNGGTTVNTQSVFNGDAVTLPTSFKTGYTQINWVDDNGITYRPGDRFTMPIGDVNLTATWAINNYQLSVKAKVGTSLYDDLSPYATFDVYVNGTRTDDYITSYSKYLPYNTAYDVRDIKTKPGIKYDGKSVLSMGGTIPASNVTVELPFSINTYSIGYNLDGGSITGNPISYKTSSGNLNIINPSKVGYTFTGWTESISPKDWYNGFIDYNIGDSYYTPTYPNAVFSEQIDIHPGTYTLDLEGLPKDQVRVRQYRKDGSYVGNVTGDNYAKFTIEEEGYVRILMLENNATAKSTVKLTREIDKAIINTGSAGDRKYAAKWTANKYTIVYDDNIGTNKGVSSTHTFDVSQALTNNTYKFAGHNFKEWNTNSYGLGTSYKNGEVVKNLTNKSGGSVTLYAQWERTTQTMTINTNNGDSTRTVQGVTGEDVNLGVPVRPGFKFTSWKHTGGDVGIPTRAYDFSDGTTKSVSVYKYGSTDSELYGSLEIVPASIDNPTSSNYEAKITATTPYEIDGKTTYVGFRTGSSVQSNNSYCHTFKAKVPKGVRLGIAYNNRGVGSVGPTWLTSPYGTGEWETYSYRITLGENPTASTIGYVYVESIDPSVAVPFNWSLAETKIVDITIGNPKGITGIIGNTNTTVTAQWTPISYNVKYDANGGTGTTANSAHTYNSTGKLTPNGFTKEYNTFKGWNTKPDGSGVSYTDNQSVSNLTTVDGSTVTLYAQWQAHTISLRFNSNGGTRYDYATGVLKPTSDPLMVDTKPYDYYEPSRGGLYSFCGDGWVCMKREGYDYPSRSEEWIVNSPTSGITQHGEEPVKYIDIVKKAGKLEQLKTGNVTVDLYANWILRDYSIASNLNGGTSTAIPSNYTMTSNTITLPNPTKTGHTFNGWIERIKPSVWYKGDLAHEGDIVVSTRNAYYSDKLFVKAGQTYKWDSDGATSGARFYPKDGSTPVYITHEQTGFTPSQDGYIRLLNVYHDTNLDRANKLYLETVTPTKDLTILKGSTGNREYIAKWTPIKYMLDVNAYVDGTLVGPKLPLRFDMYLNGSLWKDGLEDFCYEQNYGTKYEIKNIVPSPGYSCTGVVTGSLPLSGTINKTSYVILNMTTNNYTIGYNLGGGSITGQPTNYKVTSENITLPKPTRTGYTFIGWTGSNGTTPQLDVTIPKGSTGNRTYTANWKENVLTVNYYSNYATEAFASALNPVGADKNVLVRVVKYPASSPVPNGLHDYNVGYEERVMKRDGYTGTGNYGTTTTGGKLVHQDAVFDNGMALAKALGTSIDKDDATINVYPQWTINKGNLYYYPNGGVVGGNYGAGHSLITSGEFAGAYDTPQAFNYNTTTGNTVADVISYFTRTGYHSAPSAQAWRLGSPTSTTYIADNNQDLSGFVKDKTNVNLKLYANWVANTYTVSYNANGGSGTTASSSHTYDTSKALTSNGFSKTGYTFSGWNTKADGSGTSYTNAQSVKNLTATQGANITLYAQWKVNTYTYNINYKSSTGKSLGTSTVSGTFGSSKSVSAPAKTGYTTPSAQTVKFDSTSAKTITFTYPIVNYTISYNLGGGTVSGNPTSYNIESSTITLKNPTKTGFTFQGWTGSNGSSVQTLVSIASGSTGNKSYTANWAVNNYTITFNANGGSVSTASKTVASGAQYGTLPTPTRTGYTFAGWYTATSGGTKVSTTTVMGTSNVTVYARWTANTNTKITVKHNTMNYDGHTYTLADTVTTTGTSDATITLSNYKKSYSGLTYTSGKVGGTIVTTTTVSADGSRIIDLYYSRDEAVLVNGSSFKTAMTTVGPNATSVVFQKEPIASSKVSTAKVVSDSTSTKKAYMYLDGTKIVIAPESTGVMISANTDCSTMFYNRTPLTSITFDNFNTSRTTNMFHMFGYLPKLTTLDLTSFNTSNVTSMASMFIGCTGFTSIDVSSFDVSNVTNLAGMFMDCENITTLNLSNFKTGNTLYFKDMFNGMTKLATLNISNFNTSKATTFQSMFAGCSSLRSIALTKFRTTNVTNMADMFKGCSSLVGANLTYFNTSKVTTMSGMFDGCTALKTVTAATLNTSSLVDTSYMFRDAINVSVTMTISSNKITKYTDMFKNAATSSTASIVLNPATEDIRPLVQNMVNTKSSNSNVSVKQ